VLYFIPYISVSLYTRVTRELLCIDIYISNATCGGTASPSSDLKALLLCRNLTFACVRIKIYTTFRGKNY